LGLLGETHSVGRRKFILIRRIWHATSKVGVLIDASLCAAPTVSPKAGHAPPGPNVYRQDNRPQQQIFDLDLDLNPDL
jgi:hypothetical protein